MLKRYRVTEIVQQAFVYEVEAESPEEAEGNVRRGIFNTNREMESKRPVRTKQLDATYEAKEIW